MPALGIENISVFGLPPVEFVTLAADLGCQHISTGLTAWGYNPHGYAPFSLRDDAALRREMNAAMRDRGVSIALGEGLTVRPGGDVRDYAADLDLFCELGIRRINTVSMDPDLTRSFDQFAVLAEMAAARGVETTTELSPGLTVPDLPTALAAVRHVGRPDFKLLIDTMHLVRSGSGPADIAALDPDLIGYVQICDAPLKPRFATYFEEAMYERMAPGTGELGLLELLAVLPRDRVFALEVPLRSEAEAGVGPHERLGKCVEATRNLFAQLDA
ncbi:TIM barrel protein [Phenylobacterium sp. LjRoot225]|uniref:sugar phosphate isomerase/epimerase family protein n=1 Tax=Phenylobacterium sp. LjRoot225 TaxID=3342285 RepID=UPI003ED0F3A3